MAEGVVMNTQARETTFPLQSLKSGPTKFKAKDADKIRRRLMKAKTGEVGPRDWIAEIDLTAYVVYKEGSSELYFKVPDVDAIQMNKRSCFKILECRDLSAADLKVTSKFGSWITMTGRLLVECNTPLMTWSHVEGDGNNVLNYKSEGVEAQKTKCHMVKTVLELRHLESMRDVLHSLKLARLQERKREHGSQLAKIREGLPEWVNFIPYQWYSATLRQALEYLFLVYTLLSLFWAVWQLYKHVEFIRSSIHPIIRLMEHYMQMTKSIIHRVDDALLVMTEFWWTYMKPIYMIIVTVTLPFTNAFKPIQQLVRLLPGVLDPIVKPLMGFYLVLKPFVTPVIAIINVVIVRTLRNSLASLSVGFRMVVNSPMTATLVDRCSQFTVWRIITEALQGKFDPLKAQLFVIQTIVIRSLKTVLLGLRFIATRIYYLSVFVKRERAYAKEETKKPAHHPSDISFSLDENKVKEE